MLLFHLKNTPNTIKKIGLLCVLLSTSCIIGQEVAVYTPSHNANSATGLYNVSSPSVSSFQKVSHIPMNNYTGRANVTIPLYEIKSGDLTVPITISYNTSGVKVNDIASSIGTNWSLNAGGSVSKTVKGLEDFYYSAERQGSTNEYSASSIGWNYLNELETNKSLYPILDNTIPFPISPLSSVMGSENPNSITEKDDPRPDLFTAFAPGLSTSFVHTKDKTPMEINHMGNTIVSTFGESDNINLFGFMDDWGGNRKIKCINKIDITNTQGAQYTFDYLDISQSADNSRGNYGLRKGKDVIYSCNQVDTYHLSKIKSAATHKEIIFNYSKYALNNDPGKYINSYRLYGKDLYDNNGNLTNKALVPNIISNEFIKKKYPQLNRIKNITFDNGSVEFTYGIKRQDFLFDQAISFVIIKDIEGKVLKKFRFVYDYFIADTNCDEQKCKRLKLTEIIVTNKEYEQIPGYTFEYNEDPLPEKSTYNQDFLGYANSTTSGLVGIGNLPTLYYAANKGKLSLFPFSLGSEYFKLPSGFSMESNLDFTKRGSLTTITYPTGGYTKFEYELNSFLLNDTEVIGGGLRLKSQTIFDQNDGAQILDYKYLDTDGKTSGRLNAIPLYGRAKLQPYGPYKGKLNVIVFDVFQSTLSQAELTDGAFIGYSRVLVQNRVTNGYTEYLYTSSDEFPDQQATVLELELANNNHTSILDSYQAAFFNENGGFGDLPIDNGLFRGKLKKQRVYKESGELIYEKSIEYSLDEYEFIPLEYYRIEKDIVEGNVTRALDYLQQMNVKSQRYLPTENITIDKFTDTNKRQTITTTNYHDSFPFIKEQKSINSTGEEVTTKNYYTADKDELSGLSDNQQLALDDMITNKRFGVVIQRESYKGSRKVFTERTNFKTIAAINLTVPELVQTSKGAALLENRIIYNDYDSSGNPIEITQADGAQVSYIWGYNNEFPIAKIENASYDDIAAALGITKEVLKAYDESNLEEINSLRQKSEMGDAFIATYTYVPLIGVTSITDPRGYTMYYEYDASNRLEYVKDAEGNLISENKYTYKK